MLKAKRAAWFFLLFVLWGPVTRATTTPNPIPFITILSPLRVAPGAATFTLTVRGANFVANSTVNWGTNVLTTSFVSRAELTATVPASLLITTGAAPITVLNPTPGGGTSNTSYIQVNSSSGIFNPVITSYNGLNHGLNSFYIYATAQGDFNGDGKLDIVASDYYGYEDIYLGNGDGTFQAPVSYDDIYGAYGVAVGDVNNDGNLDLVVADSSSSTSFSVHLGNGDGTFQAATQFGSGDPGYFPILADMNGDGNLDIVIDTGAVVRYYQGNGDGTFQAPTTLGAVDGGAETIGVGDFDGDGILDVMAEDYNDSNVLFFHGNGDGTFAAGVTYTGQASTQSAATGDFNEDGLLDFVAGANGSVTTLLLNNGSGFSASTALSLGSDVQSVGAVDLNGDGHLDLVAGTGGGLTVSQGAGDGTFGAATAFDATQFYGESISFGNYVLGGGLGVLVPNYNTGGFDVFLPTVSISPSPYNFGSVAVNSSAGPLVLTITNNTPTSVNLSGESISGANSGDFLSGMTTCGATLEGNGGFCTVQVTFAPTASGSRQAVFTVTDTALGGSQTAQLTGTGVTAPAAMLAPTSLTFSYQVVSSTSASQLVTLKNNGSAILNISSIVVSGTNQGDFGQNNACGSTLAINASCAINVTFTPTAAGSRSASISITDDALDSPETIGLTGVGVIDPVNLSTNSLSFTARTVGTTSAAQNVVLTNQNSTALTINSIGVTGTNSGDFSQNNTCGASVAAGASCMISVTFTPSASGSRTAAVTIDDGSAQSPHTIMLSGTGLAISTATTLVVAPTSTAYGQSVTMTGTVTPAPTGSSLGTITFKNGGSVLGAASVNSSGVATFASSTLPAGSYTVTANYSGGGAFAASVSLSSSLTIAALTTSTALVAAPTSSTFGGSVTLTATITPAPAVTPYGSASFYSGATLVGSGTVNSSGIATLSTTALPAGSLSLTAIYSGTTDYAGSTSTVVTFVVSQVSTTTVLVAAPNPVTSGQTATLTATITPAPTVTPYGSVVFYSGTTQVGTGTVSSSGVATATSTTLPVGVLSLTAAYGGDTDFAASTSTAQSLTVVVATATALSVTPNPAAYGQTLTLTATVTPAPIGSPLGTVSFTQGSTQLGTGAVNSSGVATFTVNNLSAGPYTFAASYSGNTTSLASISSTQSVTVNPAATTTVLTGSPSPATYGQSVTLTATISPAPTGTSLGTVNFLNGSTQIGTGTVSSTGVATTTSTTLPAGALSLTAVYSGNANYTASAASALALTINTTYNVVAPATPYDVAQGGSVNVNVTVPPLGGAYNSIVTMSASGLPAGATAIFAPPTVTPGATGAPTMMTIQLAPLAAGMVAPDSHRRPSGLLAALWHANFGAALATLATFVAMLALLWAPRRYRLARAIQVAALIALAGFLGTSLMGCSGGFLRPPSTQPGSFTVKVIGTSGSSQASTTVSVVVE